MSKLYLRRIANPKDIWSSYTVGKVYEVIKEKNGYLYTVDDTGTDYNVRKEKIDNGTCDRWRYAESSIENSEEDKFRERLLNS